MIQFDEHIFQRGWFNHQLYSFIWRFPTIKALLAAAGMAAAAAGKADSVIFLLDARATPRLGRLGLEP